ncbi:uncharacterized protein LOC132537597 [Erinaceus europaeus]|uniref:Uncharacterized protein LOC132537597 n=1 Tax=Erinaceus europaeus TaxID=9365 RepID=A0ABM3X6K0_ERIEU|nr:uncharacterized protein LOC132537597 [Erinaceus europaeus]
MRSGARGAAQRADSGRAASPPGWSPSPPSLQMAGRYARPRPPDSAAATRPPHDPPPHPQLRGAGPAGRAPRREQCGAGNPLQRTGALAFPRNRLHCHQRCSRTAKPPYPCARGTAEPHHREGAPSTLELEAGAAWALRPAQGKSILAGKVPPSVRERNRGCASGGNPENPCKNVRLLQGTWMIHYPGQAEPLSSSAPIRPEMAGDTQDSLMAGWTTSVTICALTHHLPSPPELPPPAKSRFPRGLDGKLQAVWTEQPESSYLASSLPPAPQLFRVWDLGFNCQEVPVQRFPRSEAPSLQLAHPKLGSVGS